MAPMTLRGRLRSERGAKLIELTLVVPISVLLVGAVTESGMLPGTDEAGATAATLVLAGSHLAIPGLVASVLIVLIGTVATLWRR